MQMPCIAEPLANVTGYVPGKPQADAPTTGDSAYDAAGNGVLLTNEFHILHESGRNHPLRPSRLAVLDFDGEQISGLEDDPDDKNDAGNDQRLGHDFHGSTPNTPARTI
jgi:hypothetical protein